MIRALILAPGAVSAVLQSGCAGREKHSIAIVMPNIRGHLQPHRKFVCRLPASIPHRALLDGIDEAILKEARPTLLQAHCWSGRPLFAHARIGDPDEKIWSE